MLPSQMLLYIYKRILFILSPNLAHKRGSRYKCSSVWIQSYLVYYQTSKLQNIKCYQMSIVTSMRCTEKYKPLPTHGPHLPAEQRLRCEPVHGRCGWPLVVHVATLLHSPLWVDCPPETEQTMVTQINHTYLKLSHVAFPLYDAICHVMFTSRI